MIRGNNPLLLPGLLTVFGALLLFATLPQSVLAQQPSGAGTQPAPSQPPAAAATPDPPAAPKTTLADFAWLAGRWQGAWGPRVAQQVWTAPKAGSMLGTFQLTENDTTLVLELFTLVEGPNGVELRLRHFTPSLVAWEQSGPAVLNLESADPKTMVFENAVDGEPKRAVITRIDSDTYLSRFEVAPEKGDVQVTEITYHRQKEAPAAKQKH